MVTLITRTDRELGGYEVLHACVDGGIDYAFLIRDGGHCHG
jgi:hypothetical protein